MGHTPPITEAEMGCSNPLSTMETASARVCVTLSSELNADCVGYLPGLSSVIPRLKNQVIDFNLPLPLLVRVAVDNEISTLVRCSHPFFVGNSMPRFRVF